MKKTLNSTGSKECTRPLVFPSKNLDRASGTFRPVKIANTNFAVGKMNMFVEVWKMLLERRKCS